MSKKRRSTPAPAVFQNNPFRSLKGVAARTPAPAQPPSVKVDAGDDADDAELFARSVRGAKQLERGDDDAPGPGPVPRKDGSPETAAGTDTQEAALFRSAMSSIGAAVIGERRADEDDLEVDASHRSASSRMRQLKRGTIRISRELDLHGLLRDEALRSLKQFVVGAYARGEQAVLVITGKGINSPEGPVLRGAVAEWLAGPGRSMAAEVHPAPRDKGGSGAVVVFLKQK